MRSPSYRSGNDIIVHLRWNALHKRGGKQSGDINWSIITKPPPLEYSRGATLAPKHSQCDLLFNDTRFGDSAECNSSAPSSVSYKSYGQPLQRGSIRRGEQAQITMATEAAMQVHDIYTAVMVGCGRAPSDSKLK